MADLFAPNPLAQKMKVTILDLISDLRDNVFEQPDEQNDMMLVELFFKPLHPEMVAKHVVEHMLPHAEKIKARDQSFFLNNKHIFAGLPNDRIAYYSGFITDANRVTEENRAMVWSYFDTLVTMAVQLKKKK